MKKMIYLINANAYNLHMNTYLLQILNVLK